MYLEKLVGDKKTVLPKIIIILIFLNNNYTQLEPFVSFVGPEILNDDGIYSLALYLNDSSSTSLFPFSLLHLPMSMHFLSSDSDQEKGYAYEANATIFKSDGHIAGKGFANTRQSMMNSKIGSLLIKGHGSGNFSGETEVESYQSNISDDTWYSDSFQDLDDIEDKNEIFFKLNQLSSVYQVTSFILPGDQTINFSTGWSQASRACRSDANIYLQESDRFATKIDKSSEIILEDDGLDAKINSKFEGTSDLYYTSGASKYRQMLSGKFQSENEISYGSSISATVGTGFAIIDRQLADKGNQRSYEHGSGRIALKEKIGADDIEKALDLTYQPVLIQIAPGRWINQSQKWSEGFVNENCDSFSIREKLSSLNKLERTTRIAYTGSFNSKLRFSGMGEFRIKDTNATILEQYLGNFTMNRSLFLKGAPRFNKAHISVSKELTIDPANSEIAIYNITVLNDGNTLLDPIFVIDTFPTGTTFLDSSIEPVELESRYANWSVERLAPGDSTSFELVLGVYRKIEQLSNRIKATGFYIDTSGLTKKTTSSYNLTLPYDGMSSKLDYKEISLSMKAFQDPEDPRLIKYKMTVDNQADYDISADLIATIPPEGRFSDSSPRSKNISEENVSWNFSLDAGRKKIFNLEIELNRSGIINSRSLLYFSAAAGGSTQIIQAASSIVIAGDDDKSIVIRTIDDWLPGDLLNEYPKGICGSGACPCLFPLDRKYSNLTSIKYISDNNIYGTDLGCIC